MDIEVQNISKRFGGFTALNEVSLTIRSGELIALLGSSGSGKTTLLRMIGGLEIPDEGDILFNGSSEVGKDIRERHIGFVFQNYALFRHMSVFDNVAFGLNVRPRKTRPSKKEIRERVLELLQLVQLEGLEKRFPAQLSGGQRQRVALARALAIEPKVLLLDEPFGALDAKVRQELRRWVRHLQRRLNITTIFVTHDQEEALEIADRVAVMEKGNILQIGTPEEIYGQPATPFVCSFIGKVNQLSGEVQKGKARIGSIVFHLPARTVRDGSRITAYVRPHEIVLVPDRKGISANITAVYTLGPRVVLELAAEGLTETIEAEISEEQFRQSNPYPGQTVSISFKKAKLFTEEGSPILFEDHVVYSFAGPVKATL
jgi:sulfate transport system ATP-binding protein